ncbi:unnamed protein product [Notodromas monacha]|uniref:Glycosyltransferase family 92 protein n=1 Tax=Notodromas monacha TaxID=399045 RepID=A0A7R9GIR9_9CRUS|nr:unnamed protein product [Notodromas monacha]CAG0922760.1 unnamed protein product [Notodromas monacha]
MKKLLLFSLVSMTPSGGAVAKTGGMFWKIKLDNDVSQLLVLQVKTITTEAVISHSLAAKDEEILAAMPSLVPEKRAKDNYLKNLENSLDNVPVNLLLDEIATPSECLPDKPCFPDLYNLHFTSRQYQVLEAFFGTMDIKSCAADSRGSKGPFVRCITYLVAKEEFFIAHLNRTRIFKGKLMLKDSSMFRLGLIFWDENREMIHKSALETTIATDHVTHLTNSVYVFNFPAREPGIIKKTVAVSLVCEEDVTSVTNVLKIEQPRIEPRHGFVLCAENFFAPFRDDSLQLKEWFEIQRAFGITKLVFPVTGEFQHPNVTKLFQNYEKKGFLEVKQSNWPGRFSYPTGIQRLSIPATEFASFVYQIQIGVERIDLQACLLDSIDKYQYASILDVDEVVAVKPRKLKTWDQLLTFGLRKTFAHSSTICFLEQQMISSQEPLVYWESTQNLTGFPGIPKHLFYLNRVFSVNDVDERGYLPHRMKCIHDLSQVLTANVHDVDSCVEGVSRRRCDRHWVSGRMLQVFHFRSRCRKSRSDYGVLYFPCEMDEASFGDLLWDTTLWKYTDEVVSAMNGSVTWED